MRIMVVSAHYPPNFVSGGTLQPQRLARGLAERGHDVNVYAGWLGDRPPLSTWDETDETGLDVHWIVTTPWIGWDDERNWFNSEVTADFRDHLHRHSPDVVHFHSLQSVGAGLLPAAKVSGARVVVTMHDFWWRCPRQFLVDPDLQPCSLVVDAGVCPCQSGEASRRARAHRLEALLDAADLVLAPSVSAARVLEANGVARGRIDVDENGLPADICSALSAAHRAPRSGADDDGVVRFLYAGGRDPMKGATVLAEAANRVHPRTGWRLSAYGLDPLPGALAEGVPVEVCEPYPPDGLAGVLATHDVLVLPSVMRESHSLLTREALAAGLPVVCTDTLGPEEVVEHGRNGLIVPAGDAVALAAALERVATDEQLRATLARGASDPVPARSLADQVAQLDATFAELVEVTPPPMASATAEGVRRVVFGCGIEGAPLRYRARLPAEALELLGVATEVRHYRDPELPELVIDADVLVLYRVPATVQVLELIATAHHHDVPVVFDVDDLIFDPEVAAEIPALRLLAAEEAALWLDGVRRYRTTLEACDAFIGSTPMLVDHAAAVGGLPAHLFGNGIGFELARAADRAVRRPRLAGPPRIGYFSGTTTHDEDWFHVEPAVIATLERHGDVELWLGGHLPDTPALAPFGSRVVRLPFAPWRELPGVLRDLDVNLAPLAPGGRFNEAKSAIKWLEAALAATPTVASPSGPFRDAIDDGVTGRLCESHDEWIDAIGALLDDDGERARMGAAARRAALLEWAPARQGPRYLDILYAVVEAGPRLARDSAWEPVSPDEPPVAITLEPYRASDAHAATGSAGAPSSARLADLARRGVASVRADGARATARKLVVKVRRRTPRRGV